MFTSQVAFRQEFQETLASLTLNQWFDEIRGEQATLADFANPIALREFLRSPNSPEPRVREIWRALIRATQARRTPEAITFVLGLLQPALGAFVDKALTEAALTKNSAGEPMEAEDVWQQVVASALRALANARLPSRDVVFAGLLIDIRQPFRSWVRAQLDTVKHEAPLLDSPYDATFDGLHDLAAEASVLTDWCRAARISKKDAELIFRTRVAGFRLSRLAPAQSPRYYRLRKRRGRAESRLKAWLVSAHAKDFASARKVDVPNHLKNCAL